MFETLRPLPTDAILDLMTEFRADPRPGKIDLGVGVYRDASGATPVMRAVKAAERRLLETETTKTYTSLAGDPAFHAAIAGLVLGPQADAARLAVSATPGGSGALRQGFELIRLARPDARIWVPDPTWPNHLSVIGHVGLASATYRYFDAARHAVDIGAMLADLEAARAGDVVLLHGCCHNPTGADLPPEAWEALAALFGRTGALPMVDLAYQGLAEGLDEDAAGLRRLAATLPELLIASSASKNFGLYRERTGALIALTEPGRRAVTQGTLAVLNGQNFSFPPDHGARLVTMILADPGLAADWQAELAEARGRIAALRRQLADELAALSGSDRFGFLAGQHGMFSRLGVSPDALRRLKDEHAIYIVSDSRMNIAGLNPATVPVLARAILAALP